MRPTQHQLRWKPFVVRILFPTLLAVALFVTALFVVILPDVEGNLLERKRDTIRELTRSAVSVLREYEQEERSGVLSREDAQRGAIARIRDLRYGPESKDYFWITDLEPRMLMHPFRTDLNGKDVSSFKDPRGRHVFREFVKVVRERGSGYVDYVWQWKDDPSRLVPKESFVMLFRPWGWIVGTGLYVEDVRAEIAKLTGRLITISLLITGFVSLILLFVAQQSLHIERQRSEAAHALHESSERYRVLVEAATEGSMMVIDGRCAYSNPTIGRLLGYRTEELAKLELLELAPEDPQDPARLFFRELIAGRAPPAPLDAQLRRASGEPVSVLLAANRIAIGDKTGFIVTARDNSGVKLIEQQLGQSREQFRALREAIDLGIFHATAGRRSRVLEINPAARRILGFGETENLTATNLLDRCLDAEERASLFRSLTADGIVRNRMLQIRRKNGSVGHVCLSAVIVRDDQGRPRYCDGVVEDITERRRLEADREVLIEQMQTSLAFLTEPVRRSQHELISCPPDTPVARAAAQMSSSRCTALLVVSERGDPLGIVTDRDMRERVLAAGLDSSTPVFQVMTAPICSVPDTAPVYEALLRMREKAIQHLAIKDDAGRVLGVVQHQDLLSLHRYSSAVLVHEIGRARSIEELAACHDRLPLSVRALVDWGARPRALTRVITAVSDAICARLVGLAIEDLGPPPARFAFLAMGSEGRQEQTLATDQDNALIYEDVPAAAEAAASAYFLEFGRRVCEGLARAGYAYCEGGAMAREQQWNQPLSRWKDYFARWIGAATPQDLLAVNMFFDFRAVHGEVSLAVTLRAHIDASIAEHPPFLLHFAQNALHYKPPIGMFGRIVVGAAGEQGRTFSVKEAMLPITNFARLYALKHGVEETNTLARLRRLQDKGVIKRSTHDEVVASYRFLMQLRLRHQATTLTAPERPAATRGEDLRGLNQLNPKDLSDSEEVLLKQALAQVSLVLKKISFDFLGQA